MGLTWAGWNPGIAPGFPVQAGDSSTLSFVQDRFAIGFWVPPQTETDLRTRYQEIADANFTVVVGAGGAQLPEQLALCQEFQLRALVSGAGSVASWPDHDACWGYLLTDEPHAREFPALAAKADEVRRLHPGRLPYINLFPNYASKEQLGTGTYEEHVAAFVRAVKPEVLSMDHYPLMRPERETRDAYCENLAVFRTQSLAAKVPFWNYFYSMPFNDRLDPTEAQIRWQINASIAYGAKGVLYFCYWTPGKGAGGAGEFPKGGALLTAEGFKTRHFEEARRINRELRQLGPTLMKLTSTEVRRLAIGPKQPAATTPGALSSLSAVPGDPASEFLMGEFRHTDGRRAVWLVNQSYAYTAWPTVEFNAPLLDVVEVDPNSGQSVPVRDDSPELKGLQLSFAAGGARLFLLPASP
jgi:hypothetical protein